MKNNWRIQKYFTWVSKVTYSSCLQIRFGATILRMELVELRSMVIKYSEAGTAPKNEGPAL